MINVNKIEIPWEEGMTVESLLEKLKTDGRLAYLVNPAVMVVVNGEIVPFKQYTLQIINDGDTIMLKIHMTGG